MKTILIPLLVITTLLIGCESTPHYNRTKVVTLGEALPKKPYGSVKLYQSKEEVPGNYDVVAIMSTAVGAVSSAIAVHVTGRRWLSSR